MCLRNNQKIYDGCSEQSNQIVQLRVSKFYILWKEKIGYEIIDQLFSFNLSVCLISLKMFSLSCLKDHLFPELSREVAIL